MFEHRREALISRVAFRKRMLIFGTLAGGVLVVSLGIGALGYHLLEGFTWIDSVLNASMILGGMGPVGELKTNGGKVFASAYALYSGVVFLVAAGLLVAPIFHRFLHRFHLDKVNQK
jgi:hypothetical protein